MKPDPADNLPYRLPRRLFDARCTACWFTLAIALLVGASFWSLDLQWRAFVSADALASMGRFIGEFFPPDVSQPFLGKVIVAAGETLAMSALGTLLAVLLGLALALPAARLHAGDRAWAKTPTRLLLNALRSIPELVWATLPKKGCDRSGGKNSPMKRPMLAAASPEMKTRHCRSSDPKLATTSSTTPNKNQQAVQRT